MSIEAFIERITAKLLIDGHLAAAVSENTFDTINPADGNVVATLADAGAEDVDCAVRAARRAFASGEWSRMKPFDRQQCLLRLADLVERDFDDLALLDTMEMGSPISTAGPRKRRCMALLRYYAGLATNLHGQTIPNSAPGHFASATLREPVGVVGAITPWNAPLTMAIWKIAPAIATGCTIILKPSENASLSSLRFGELCLEAGIPRGVVNIVCGGGDAGAALAAHGGVDKVTFTGSTETGRAIVRASSGNLKRVSLELGGKSPNIVFADADMDWAIPGCAMAVFANSGQICSAGTRLFVERTVREEFVERLVAFARSLKVGDPRLPETQLGPLVSERQASRVKAYISRGIDEGARLLTGGARPEHASGFYVEPAVFSDVDDEMTIAREEIFGPVASVLGFDTAEEAIDRGNNTPYGLGGGVWTRDMAKAHQVSTALRTGTVWVNCYQTMDAAVPFGGYKASGYGRESGTEHVDEYLSTKAVWTRYM